MAAYLPTLVLATSLTLATGLETRLLQVGDHVVVYATLAGCPEFPGIIAAPEINSDGMIELPHVEPIDAMERTEAEILADVSSAIATRKPNGDVTPNLKIDVVSRQGYLGVADLYMASLYFLASGRCQGSSSDELRHWRDRWIREHEHLERLRQLERNRTAWRPINTSTQQVIVASGSQAPTRFDAAA